MITLIFGGLAITFGWTTIRLWLSRRALAARVKQLEAQNKPGRILGR